MTSDTSPGAAALPPRGRPRLEGRVTIVTGAGNAGEGVGNGRATAVLFAREGARVLLVDRDLDAIRGTLAMIEAESGEAEVLQADVTAEEDCAGITRRAMERWGRLDVLHNNVGMGSRGTILDHTLEEWEQIQRTNVTSMVLTSKHAIPAMIRGGGGSIINVSSIAALRPRGITAYSVSKGAVITLTRSMARDHAADGVRVNCIAPGPIYTPRMAQAGVDAERREQRRRASPLGLEGVAWDVAYAAVYLASDEARYVTGVVLPVDGGVLLMSPER